MKPKQLKVGVKTLLINNETQVLLVRRAAYPKDQWEIPGGRIDSHETLEEALKREIKEEVGINDFEILGILGAQDIFPKIDPDTHVVRITYISRVTEYDIKLSSEHSEYKWVSFEELNGQEGIDPYCSELIKDRRYVMSFIKDIIKDK